LLEFRRLRPQVNDYIVDGTSGASHKLGLGVRRILIMDATKSACVRVKGDTALHQLRLQPVTFEFLLAPGSRKESPFITRRLDL